MKMKLWFVFWLVIFSAVAVSGSADDTILAKEKIEEGKRLIREEKYGEALAAFELSYSLRPKAWVLFNIAMCNKALHRYVDAIEAFQRFLETETDPESQTSTLALSALEELGRFVGKVRVVEAPVGATVYIDGEKVGIAPIIEPLALDPGRHVVRVSKDRFKSLDVEVIVASGSEVEVRADLQQPKAELKVSCIGDKTVVFIDEAAVGTCPYQGSVEAGVHEVKVIEPGKQTFIQTVEASAGSTLVIAVDLKPVIVIKPPTFINEPQTTNETRVPLILRASGIGAIGVGVVSIIIGGVFTGKWHSHFDVVAEKVDTADNVNHPDNEAGWTDAYNEWVSAAATAESYQNGFIVAYAVGGSLTAVGGLLLVLGRIKGKKEASSLVSVSPRIMGVAFEF